MQYIIISCQSSLYFLPLYNIIIYFAKLLRFVWHSKHICMSYSSTIDRSAYRVCLMKSSVIGMVPRQLSPRQLSHQQLSPPQLSPRQLSPQQLNPRQLSPQRLSPRHSIHVNLHWNQLSHLNLNLEKIDRPDN